MLVYVASEPNLEVHGRGDTRDLGGGRGVLLEDGPPAGGASWRSSWERERRGLRTMAFFFVFSGCIDGSTLFVCLCGRWARR
jgi:hypothetical protein